MTAFCECAAGLSICSRTRTVSGACSIEHRLKSPTRDRCGFVAKPWTLQRVHGPGVHHERDIRHDVDRPHERPRARQQERQEGTEPQCTQDLATAPPGHCRRPRRRKRRRSASHELIR